jgi:hypothetical protein
MLCKHCFDILGYDNKYTNRIINQECEYCKTGLSKSDIIYAEDIMVPLILKLNKELNIKTFYSCVGHINSGVVMPTYLVLEDTEKARYIFNEIISSQWSYGIISKDGKNKIRVEFRESREYTDVYEHTVEKANLIKFVYKFIDDIINSDSYPF